MQLPSDVQHNTEEKNWLLLMLHCNFHYEEPFVEWKLLFSSAHEKNPGNLTHIDLLGQAVMVEHAMKLANFKQYNNYQKQFIE